MAQTDWYAPYCAEGSRVHRTEQLDPQMPFRCHDCGQFINSVRTGTVMQRSKIGFEDWLIAMQRVLSNATAEGSMKLDHELGSRISRRGCWLIGFALRALRCSIRLRPSRRSRRCHRTGLPNSRCVHSEAVVRLNGPIRQDSGDHAFERGWQWWELPSQAILSVAGRWRGRLSSCPPITALLRVRYDAFR